LFVIVSEAIYRGKTEALPLAGKNSLPLPFPLRPACHRLSILCAYQHYFFPHRRKAFCRSGHSSQRRALLLFNAELIFALAEFSWPAGTPRARWQRSGTYLEAAFFLPSETVFRFISHDELLLLESRLHVRGLLNFCQCLISVCGNLQPGARGYSHLR